jgi:hypothetical protein
VVVEGCYEKARNGAVLVGCAKIPKSGVNFWTRNNARTANAPITTIPPVSCEMYSELYFERY